MRKTILFSPVGGTDPISQNNMKDGSLLHICRWYKPDEVYLYMSKEMLEFQAIDDRYRYCINELSRMQNREILIHEIERPELVNVQEYDIFYNDFKKCLIELKSNYDKEIELLLNVSSGTPAMKSALLVLATLGEFDCKSIQVVTPTGRLGEHSHKDYDNELWEINEDNDPEAVNRCRVVQCPTLSYIKQEEIIKQFVLEYNYKAAIVAAQQLPEEYTRNYIPLLEIASRRLQLIDTGLMTDVKKYAMPGFPVKNDEARKYFEYTLSLGIKLAHNELADFCRALSPILVKLFVLILEKEFDISIEDYTCEKDKKVYWSRKKLEGTAIEKILLEKWDNFDYSWLKSIHIVCLIEAKSQNSNVIQIVQELRNVEGKIRNIAAHEIVAVTDQEIKKQTGNTAEQVYDLLKEAFKYTSLNVRTDYWNAYDEMNRFIIKKIEEQ